MKRLLLAGLVLVVATGCDTVQPFQLLNPRTTPGPGHVRHALVVPQNVRVLDGSAPQIGDAVAITRDTEVSP